MHVNICALIKQMDLTYSGETQETEVATSKFIGSVIWKPFIFWDFYFLFWCLTWKELKHSTTIPIKAQRCQTIKSLSKFPLVT